MVKQRKYIFRLIGILFFFILLFRSCCSVPNPRHQYLGKSRRQPGAGGNDTADCLSADRSYPGARLIDHDNFLYPICHCALFSSPGYRYPANSFEPNYHRDFVVSDFICHDACLRGSQQHGP